MLTMEMVGMIFNASTQPYEKLLYSLLLTTGQKASILLDLKVSDIFKEDNRLILKMNVQQLGRSVRVFTNELRAFEPIYINYLNWRSKIAVTVEDDWLFVNKYGRHLSRQCAQIQLKKTLCNGNVITKEHISLRSFRKMWIQQMIKMDIPFNIIIENSGYLSVKPILDVMEKDMLPYM